MKSNLFRLLALMLCFCALLTCVACGKDAPAKADDITPPVDDTPTADEPAAGEPATPDEPSDTPDEPSQPDVPVEPDVPTEPAEPDDTPNEPGEPTELEQPTEPDVPSDTPTTPEDKPTADEPIQPTEPSEPETPTESEQPVEPTIPDLYMAPVPTPIKPDTQVNYEKWSSLDAQAILSQYERVLRGEEMVYNTTTKKEEYFDDPENDPDTVWGRAWITIVDFDQNGIPEILVKFSNDSMPFYALYYLNDKIYLDHIQRSSATGLYKDYVFCSSGGIYNHYYNVYELTETGLRYNEIAMSNAKQALLEDGTPQLEYIYQLNGENVTKEEFGAFLEWLVVPETPTEPSEPEHPVEPTEPTEPNQPTEPEYTASGMLIDDSTMWDPESYDEIIKFFNGSARFLVKRSDGHILFFNPSGVDEDYNPFVNNLVMNTSVTNIEKGYCFIYILDEYSNHQYLYVNDIAFLSNIASVHSNPGDNLETYAITTGGDIWLWREESYTTGPVSFGSFLDQPLKIEGVWKQYYYNESYSLTRYLLSKDGKLYALSLKPEDSSYRYIPPLFPSSYEECAYTYSYQLIAEDIKEIVASNYVVTSKDQLARISQSNNEYSVDVVLSNVSKCKDGFRYLSVLDKDGNCWSIDENNNIACIPVPDNCKYVFTDTFGFKSFYYLDEHHNLWLADNGSRVKLAEDVVFAFGESDSSVKRYYYIKADGTLWDENSLVYDDVKLPK